MEDTYDEPSTDEQRMRAVLTTFYPLGAIDEYYFFSDAQSIADGHVTSYMIAIMMKCEYKKGRIENVPEYVWKTLEQPLTFMSLADAQARIRSWERDYVIRRYLADSRPEKSRFYPAWAVEAAEQTSSEPSELRCLTRAATRKPTKGDVRWPTGRLESSPESCFRVDDSGLVDSDLIADIVNENDLVMSPSAS